MREGVVKNDGLDYVLDKGYAWIVLLGVSLSTFLEMGNFKTFGVFFVTFLEEFQASATMTSLINAVYSFTFSLFVLPVETMLIERYTCRSILFVGGLATSLALTCSSFATKIETLILTNGVLLAIGSACTHGPSMIILGKYFEKKRGLTNSIAISFGSLGGFVQPILFTAMMAEFSLRGALLLQGGILFNCIVAAALSRPLQKSIKFARHSVKSDHDDDKRCALNLKSSEVDLHESKYEIDDHNSVLQNRKRLADKLHLSETDNFKKSTSSIAQYSSAFDLYSVSIADISENIESSAPKKKLNRNICSYLVDFSVLKNKLVLLFTIVFCLASMASCSAFLFIPPHARDRGLSEQEVSIIASLICVAEFVSRLLLALIADRKFIQRYQIIMIALLMNGITLQFSWFLRESSHFLAFTICYGMFSGALISLYAPVCVDFIGVDNFHKAMGVLHMGQGITIGATGFILGVMRDYTGSYVAGFHVLGGSGLLAAALLLLVPRLRENNKSNDSVSHKNREQNYVHD